MKKSLIILFILILPILIFFFTSHYGNPITRIIAYNEIKKYAITEFKDFEYTLKNIEYNPKFNLYCIKLDIPYSEDKDFYINYKNGEIFDEREMVTNGTNISNRIQPILNDLKYEEPVKSLFKDNLNFSYLTLKGDAWSEVRYDISIDDFFNEYTLRLTVYINNPIDNEKDYINKLKQEYKNLGLNVDEIEIAAF